ncbi:MAG: GAF domain-containing protein [Yoonia sp.]|uniref:GAF domain-containing protein n=1 Tax=Yoonia sp. TaxID=2212373 RepID=UPI003EF98F0D
MASASSHIDKIARAVQSGAAGAQSRLAASWFRSMVKHGLDPAEARAPEYLSAHDIHARREALGRVAVIAKPKLDQLFALVGSSGCGVVLTDNQGVIVDHRFGSADMRVFRDWGLDTGADWSEATQGTNGIGTCLTERREVVIHRDQHFMASNIAMSCIDAPVFGAEGQIVAALDVSSARADQTETMNGMISELVRQAARSIEADNFQDKFSDARVLVVNDPGDGVALLATNADDIVIGATRAARRGFGLQPEGALKPVALGDLIGRDRTSKGFERAQKAAVMRALVRADRNVSLAARELGVSRATLYRRMKRLGITA